MAVFSVRKTIDIVPDALFPLIQISCPKGIQQHQPAAIELCAKCCLQSSNRICQFLLISKILSLQNTVDRRSQIPMRSQTIFQIGLNLCTAAAVRNVPLSSADSYKTECIKCPIREKELTLACTAREVYIALSVFVLASHLPPSEIYCAYRYHLSVR